VSRTPEKLEPVGLQLWFSLAALIIGLLFAIASLLTVAYLLFFAAAIWGLTGVTRALRIHRYVTRR